MKALKGILFFIIGLLISASIFFVVYLVSPDFAGRVSGFLNADDAADASLSAEGEEAGTPLIQPGTQEGAVEEGEDSGDVPVNYIPPDRSSVQVPAAVAGRSGYMPVQEDAEEVDDEEARQIREEIGYGETGDDLSFDGEFYPYYEMLDSELQKLYRQIYANTMALNDTFAPIIPVGQEEVYQVFLAVSNDHPALFWLDSGYRLRGSQSGEIAEIMLIFNRTADDLEASRAAFLSSAEEILNGASGLLSDYDKEVYVHNALLDRVEYDLQAPMNQSAYSALVNGETVCAGYARAFQYLMQQLGIPCYCCTGFAGENHAWNIIRLDGDYYNVDTTWDDTDPNTFDFFNKTDADFSGTHVREDLSVNLPPCNGTIHANRESNPEETEGGQDTQTPDAGDGTASSGNILEQLPGDSGAGAGQNTGQGIDPGQNAGTGLVRRSLQEVGFTESDVISDMATYYEDCYNQIMEAGGSATFSSVVQDINLWNACTDAYSQNAFAEGYGNRVLEELGAKTCEVGVIGEELMNGRILMQHTVEIGY